MNSARISNASQAELKLIAQKAWDGELSNGSLVLIDCQRYAKNEGKKEVFKLLNISSDVPMVYKRVVSFGSSNLESTLKVAELNFGDSYASLGWPSEYGGTIIAPHESFLQYYDDYNRHSFWRQRNPQLALVNCEKPTAEEVLNLFREFAKSSRVPVAFLVGWFGAEMVFTNARIGDEYHLPHSSHHSGSMDGTILKLPTGRWAAIASYSSWEEDNDDWQCCMGVGEDPLALMEPDFSGKYQRADFGPLALPKPEEIDFLQTRGIDLDQ